jgi:hypothetical protein
MKKLSIFASGVALGALQILAASSGAKATVIMENSLPAWQSAAGDWSETTNFGVSAFSYVTNFTTTNGVNVSVETGNSSYYETVFDIGAGWGTWPGNYKGQLLGDYLVTSVTYTLNTPVNGFGLFVEPDPFAVTDITMTTSTGASLTQGLSGDAGAAFFGWTGAGVTSFTLSSSADFAAGDIFSSVATSAAPEPSTWAMMLLGFVSLGFAKYRRKESRISLAAGSLHG